MRSRTHSATRNERTRPRLGLLLREWRSYKQVSQLDLSTDTGISQRHLSFIESGRAAPSREMILRIAETLDLPLRARNELLGAAGFVGLYPERDIGNAELKPASEALRRILTHHEPYPALVLDRFWNILLSNRAANRLLKRCSTAIEMREISAGRPLNFMRAMFNPQGIRKRIRNWELTAGILIGRLRREVAAFPGSPSEDLLRELLPGTGISSRLVTEYLPGPPTISVELDLDGRLLRLFNTLTTFGTAQDVTLQELRVDMSFPVDDASDTLLRCLAD